jgi:hypothetical protein
MRLSIDGNCKDCPFGMPVGLWALDTLQLIDCYKTVLDAQKARAIKQGNDPTVKPDLFDRSVAYSLPPTVGW